MWLIFGIILIITAFRALIRAIIDRDWSSTKAPLIILAFLAAFELYSHYDYQNKLTFARADVAEEHGWHLEDLTKEQHKIVEREAAEAVDDDQESRAEDDRDNLL